MHAPVIVIVDADEDALDAVAGDLRLRYEPAFRVLCAGTGEAALDASRHLRDQDAAVALFLAADQLPGSRGAAFLAEARTIHPQAGRLLVTEHPQAEAAITAVNELGVQRYVVKPCHPPEDKLYPAVDDLLDDWRARAATPYLLVESIMSTRPDVVTIGHDASFRDAADIVATTQVGDLMVLDGDGSFVGVLSEGDILRNALPDFDEIIAAGATLHDAYQLFVRSARELIGKPIMPLVIRDPITMRPTDHVAQAATILIERQIRRLPVADGDQLVGTVSRADICRAVVGRP